MTEQEKNELITQLRLARSYAEDMRRNRLVPGSIRSHQVKRTLGHIDAALALVE